MSLFMTLAAVGIVTAPLPHDVKQVDASHDRQAFVVVNHPIAAPTKRIFEDPDMVPNCLPFCVR